MSEALFVTGSPLCRKPLLLQPGGQCDCYLLAAARLGESCLDAAIGDDQQGRELGDVESFEKIGALFYVDIKTDECVVVVAPLEYLGYVAVDEAASSGEAGGEEQEPRLGRAFLKDIRGLDQLPQLPCSIDASLFSCPTTDRVPIRLRPAPWLVQRSLTSG